MITTHSLTKRYGSTTAVADLDVEVRPGQVTGFLGPNGSGKSTTMRLIMGLDSPSSGHALVNGRPYHDLSWPLHEVGAALDGRSFHPGRSAQAHLSGLAKANRIRGGRVGEVLDVVGLSSVARRRAGRFSLGMGQRLAIAAALLGDPAVVILDEPTNGLDPDGIRWVRNLVRQLAGEGRTVLLSSHLIAEVANSSDRVLIIGKGHLLADLDVADLPAGVSLEDAYVELTRDSVEYRAQSEPGAFGAYPSARTTAAPAGQTTQGAPR